jgi:uncharacterized protein YdeI (YjbR/CyaY-like superfamily)
VANLDDLDRTEAPTRASWRAWLAKHHDTSPGVWLVYHKKGSGVPGVGYEEAVEEALCFGWIDSRVRSLDDRRYMQLYTPRTPGSNWSRLNKERIARLTAAGTMADAGLAAVEAAKSDGSWAQLDAVEGLIEPAELRGALDRRPIARSNFDAFSDSVKKQALYWVYSAKREDTRARRISDVVAAATENLPVAEYRQRITRDSATPT